MKKNLPLSALLALLMAAACSVEETGTLVIPDENLVEPVVQDMKVNYVDGLLKVKLTEELESVDAVAALLSDAIPVVAVFPAFPEDPRYPKRHREAGLHLWYTVCYDEEATFTRAAANLSELPGIDIVEGVPEIRSTAVSFNDPQLNNQWHYINTAQRNGYLKGADINLGEAWEFNTGNPEVIVAVIDCGARYTHEDLADNMWVNEAELNGTPGHDDDGNGYVDDIYGYNFCYVNGYSPHGTIVPEDHGTHTSGTIAAVNNNGKGGCGIAGGDGTRKGVRIMTLQIIQARSATQNYPSDAAAAFVYAADNGAVITNNSWGYDGQVPSIREAIAYFNKYAGTDDDGNQIGPMAGGLSVFAAGNDNKTTGYPAQYEEAYAVASIGPDFRRAYYSNYGNWVDICAPGGDQQAYGNFGGVYSCTAASDASYAYYQGTSMACPHVAGVAALAVSAFGGQGFTREDLIEILNDAANPDVYQYNPAYPGRLGIGLLDAGAMFRGNRPEPVTDLSGIANKNSLTLYWTVPEANEGHKVSSFEIYFGAKTINYEIDDVPSGQRISYKFENLEYDTEYNFSVCAVNEEGRRSKNSSVLTLRTEKNKAPVITPLSGTEAVMHPEMEAYLRFSVEDPEEDEWSAKVKGNTIGIGASVTSEKIIEVQFRGASIYNSHGAGRYEAVLYVTDAFGNETSLPLTYTVQEVFTPVLKGVIEDTETDAGEDWQIRLSDYFEFDSKSTVEVQAERADFLSWRIENKILYFTALSAGESTVKIIVKNQAGESAEASFRITVHEVFVETKIYPTAVKDYFYVTAAGNFRLRLLNQAGQTLLSTEYTSVKPSVPVKVEIPSRCSSGVYTVIITLADGTQTQHNIVIL